MQNPHSMMEFPSKIGYIIISSALVRIRFCCAGVFGDYGLIPKRQKLIPVTRPYALAGCLPKKKKKRQIGQLINISNNKFISTHIIFST